MYFQNLLSFYAEHYLLTLYSFILIIIMKRYLSYELSLNKKQCYIKVAKYNLFFSYF